MIRHKSLTSLGCPLDTGESCFDWCLSSTDIVHDPLLLRERLDRDGYLYLPGVLDASLVNDTREILLTQLYDLGLVDRNGPVSEGRAALPWHAQSLHQLAKANPPLWSVLYDGIMLELYEKILGTEVRHFDFTWLRAIGPGQGTAPHCDSVYMGRGTRRLFTSWTPLMEIPLNIGGLILIPGSHQVSSLDGYRTGDVDTVCSNRPHPAPKDVHGWVGPAGDGKLTDDPVELQRRLGMPWITAECYRPGDVVIFNIATIHGSLDNQTNRIRLSCDSRYQPASEPIDERWIGEDPVGHGKQSRRDIIC